MASSSSVPDLYPNPNPTSTSTSTSVRRAGRPRNPVRPKRRKEIQARLSSLRNLCIIPFPHCSSPNLSRHGPLFESLDLLRFARLEFGSSLVRSDLVTELIASYKRTDARSAVRSAVRCVVGGKLLTVNCSKLRAALSLPPRLHKPLTLPSASELELFGTTDSISAITDFVSSRMLLPDDASELGDVQIALRHVKEGRPHLVDWGHLMWRLVERELHEAPSSHKLYYGCYIEMLLKHLGCPGFDGEEMEELGDDAGLGREETMELGDDAGGDRVMQLEERLLEHLGCPGSSGAEMEELGDDTGLGREETTELGEDAGGDCVRQSEEYSMNLRQDHEVQGILLQAVNKLEALREERKKLVPETAEAMDQLLIKLKSLASGNELDDPAGNSFIENTHAPSLDPSLSVRFYDRTREQPTSLGYLVDPSLDEPERERNILASSVIGSEALGSVGAIAAQGNSEEVATALCRNSAPEEPGFGYQQQLVPGMWPGAAPMPNFFVSMGQQAHQWPVSRRAAGPTMQHPVPMIQQQPGFGYQQQLVPGMRPGAAPMPNFFVSMDQQAHQDSAAGPTMQHPVPMIQQQVAAALVHSLRSYKRQQPLLD